ncbi:SAM-dependent methyltransferase [Sphingomonas naasensis]|nr:methyltransferase domain-containing protein [Sphingomonas naasensis]NIJ19307.1 SAM-dependent methyltransferase [Sphingomonas naasensis]
MRKSTLDILRCPKCSASLALETNETADDVETGTLRCKECAATYPLTGGVARFVPAENYAHNFGVQWNMFSKTQLDSHSGHPISENRFDQYTGWREADLADRLVLDAGCGAGRFAEVALKRGARVIAIDFSHAIDAARANLRDKGDIDFIQADINALPFAPNTFPLAYCLGVIQHTPDPAISFRKLADIVAPGGRLAVDVYPAGWKNIFFVKYWIRPLTRQLSAERSYRLVEKIFPILYPVSQVVGRIPRLGHYLRYLIPVVNYEGDYPLDPRQQREWALLDTFDMWAPAYDQPQSMAALRGWFEKSGFEDIVTFHKGFFVGRGIKPTGSRR